MLLTLALVGSLPAVLKKCIVPNMKIVEFATNESPHVDLHCLPCNL